MATTAPPPPGPASPRASQQYIYGVRGENHVQEIIIPGTFTMESQLIKLETLV